MAHSVHVRLAGHHANPARFHHQVEATLTRHPDGALHLVYAIHGLNLDLRVPTPHFPAPDDALWSTTCCELFLGSVGHESYREFNFSPSGQWAAYDFVATRQRAPRLPALPAPAIDFTRDESCLKLAVTVPRAAQPAAETLRLAVSTVLEAEGGHHGHWALAHPPGQPDFHHHAGFVLSLGTLGFRPAHWP